MDAYKHFFSLISLLLMYFLFAITKSLNLAFQNLLCYWDYWNLLSTSFVSWLWHSFSKLKMHYQEFFNFVHIYYLTVSITLFHCYGILLFFDNTWLNPGSMYLSLYSTFRGDYYEMLNRSSCHLIYLYLVLPYLCN